MSLFSTPTVFREYLELKKIEAIAANNKIYYGSSIPSVFLNSEIIPAMKADDKTTGRKVEL